MIKLLLPRFWRHRKFVSYFLLPFAWIYIIFVMTRRFFYKCFPAIKFSVPIIVVGNITVGGTGKTPLVIFLADFLKKHGYHPGIISRGYGSKNCSSSRIVNASSTVEEVGDEALLMARRVTCPISVGVDRAKAAKHLLREYHCNVIISDDGLQNYKLPRNIEIAVIDAEFKFGNRFCLPAGPLREPISRLRQVDFIVKNFNTQMPHKVLPGEYTMVLEPTGFRNVRNPSFIKTAADFKGQVIHAVAGIGLPQKFFQTLRQLKLTVITHIFPDHYMFRPVDFSFEDKTIIMTEKDAIKCDKIMNENFWYLEINAKPDNEFVKKLLDKLAQYCKV